MARKLPPDFDAQRYLDSYPDVALSGLSPQEHYLRFGRTLQRKPSGSRISRKAHKPRSDAAASIGNAPEPAISMQATPKPTPVAPIIDRPVDFDPGEVVPSPAPPKPNRRLDEPLTIEVLSAGPFQSVEEGNRVRVPLLAYDGIFSRKRPRLSSGTNICGASYFQEGATRIENAWFADAATLRLRLAGTKQDEPGATGWSVRAYQADPALPGQLKMAGSGVQLPRLGPVFLDIELVHPLMPILLELSDPDEAVRGIALLPFPSLLPGGHHAAELKRLQSEFNPMDAFWAASTTLLWELFGLPDSPDRSIAEVSTYAENGTGALDPDVEQWLLAVFGLPAPAKKHASTGLRLVLPHHSIPTIGALVSRTIEVTVKNGVIGPFLVAEAATLSPRWSVSLPPSMRPQRGLPIIVPAGRESRRGVKGRPVPIPLSIAMREAALVAVSAGAPSSPMAETKVGPLTIVVEAAEAPHTESLVTMLSGLAAGGSEFIVRLPEGHGDFSDILDRCCGTHKWMLAGAADLRDLARNARHDTLLTVSDRVRLEDPRVIVELCDLLQSHPKVASASCTLLAEAIVKKRAVIQPGSGGLFPARVSFAASPRLAFYEPDVNDALADLTYPVAANTLLLTVWRSSALAGLPLPKGPVPAAAADVRLGLDLLEAGYQNLCTSQLRAVIQGPYSRRDAIDPAGAAYAEPQRWAHLLPRVTLVQELF